jgi:glycosyltransferase involved in cell wall biosynthesis
VDPKAGISVVIIAYNEAKHIGRCIDSVADIASEILVVDSFSTDNTQAIAASKGARVIQHAFEGHIQQKNWAKDQATFDWVLSLDADECLSPPLRHNLQNAIQQGLIYGKTKGYTFSRLNHLGQRAIRGCGWYPDRKMRLWDRTSGSWAGKNPHDKFVIDSQYNTGSLEGDILHYTYPNLDAVKKQAIKFGKIGGAALRSFWNIEASGTVSQRFFGPRQSGIYLIFFFFIHLLYISFLFLNKIFSLPLMLIYLLFHYNNFHYVLLPTHNLLFYFLLFYHILPTYLYLLSFSIILSHN